MEFASLHKRALAVAGNIRKSECEMISLLQQIERSRGFTSLGYASLFVYVTGELRLSEACTYQLITVSRKAVEVPQLKVAIEREELTAATAKIISPVITKENHAHWIGLARDLSKRDLEKAVANERPGAPRPEKARPMGHQMVRLELDISEETHALLLRAQELLAQKKSSSPNLADTLLVIAAAYVKREDPVAKADRNAQNTRPGTSSRKIHKVHRRDRGQCQFRHPNGKVCGQKKWLHVHHKKPKSEGGTDEPENLITLCSAHHRMVHSEGVPLQ